MLLRTLVASVLVLGAVACGDATGADPAATEPTPSETASPEPTSPPASPASSETPQTSEPTPEPTPAPTDEATADPVDAEGDCSAAGMAGGEVGQVPDDVRATAEFLLDAALRCDEQLLATAASENNTTLTYGDTDPYEFFGLPDDEGEYATMVTLLTELPHAAEADDARPGRFVWPRVATGDWADSDQAWQEVVDAGLITQQQADQMRAAGSGYMGWRIGIRGDGNWMFFVAGD